MSSITFINVTSFVTTEKKGEMWIKVYVLTSHHSILWLCNGFDADIQYKVVITDGDLHDQGFGKSAKIVIFKTNFSPDISL